MNYTYTIQLFAGLSERFGQTYLQLAAESPHLATSELKALLAQQYPEHASAIDASFLACNAVALGIAWVVGSRAGLMGPALALLGVEIAMSVWVIRDSLRLLKQPLGDFLTMLRRDPRRSLRELAASR